MYFYILKFNLLVFYAYYFNPNFLFLVNIMSLDASQSLLA